MKPLYENLREPAPLEDEALHIIPLGGLSKIDHNMNVLEHEGKPLIIDCGVLFPEVYRLGVDLIFPDFSQIVDRLDDIAGMVVTHGHEDHIGAVPYLAKLRDDIPIYGSDLTLTFTEPELHEHCFPAGDVHIIKNGDRLQLGPFKLGFAQATHSIPDALAIYVHTGAGTVLITGDLKIDHQPLDGRKTNLAALGRVGSESVDLSMIDLTDFEVPGFIPSESEIGPVLDRIVEEAEGQVVVATFVSHVHHVRQVMSAVTKVGRHVALVGRSMECNACIAAERGYLTASVDLTAGTNGLAAPPPEKRLYVATGSQDELRAALVRTSAGSYEFVNLEVEDTVVVVASSIPGNEIDVNRVASELA